jgi:hypothetical protein
MFLAAALCCFLLSAMAAAQQTEKNSDDVQNMPGMDQKQMPGMQTDENGRMNMHPETFLEEIVHHGASGTSAEPNSTPVPML